MIPDSNLLLNVVVTEPSPPKKGEYGLYRDLCMATIRKDNIPTASEWRAMGNSKLFNQVDSHAAVIKKKNNEVDKTEEEVSPRDSRVETKEEEEANSSKALGRLKDAENAFFLTEAVYDEGESEDDEFNAQRVEEAYKAFTVPGMVLQRSLFAPSGGGRQDAAKLRSAINSLKYALKYPITSAHDKNSNEVTIYCVCGKAN
jgi:hypothetical protein